MISPEKIIERQKLRRDILEKCYEIFHSAEKPFTTSEALVGTKEELYKDNEHHKAFHYLMSKDLIHISSSGSKPEKLSVFITAHGIDFVESFYKNK
ncbi:MULTISPECIES: hypothetical protein [Paenibacillus]|jgi:hypothetical protein|uniref:hypothetical protein n=1 Tax=Paenibacillus TaxID=44249 RepID=UPI00240E1BAB|nr:MULTISPECIES: hypothetical protein [Paenibacillus]MCI1776597.1 hypothetical protein [Paenibacillus lautus]WFB57574.1 hypothetical protein P0X86_27005 [Paenibacillus sp. BR1-192]